MNNIHENKQSELMSSIYQWFKFFRGSTTTTRSKKVGDMVPTVKYAGKQIEPRGDTIQSDGNCSENAAYHLLKKLY